MTLASSIETDAQSLFVETDDFAESVTYHPHQFHGETARADRTINAQVIRQPLAVFSEDGSASALRVYEIHVANDSTLGISAEELDTGGDAITFPPDAGSSTTERKQITRLIDQDAGMLVLECR